MSGMWPKVCTHFWLGAVRLVRESLVFSGYVKNALGTGAGIRAGASLALCEFRLNVHVRIGGCVCTQARVHFYIWVHGSTERWDSGLVECGKADWPSLSSTFRNLDWDTAFTPSREMEMRWGKGMLLLGVWETKQAVGRGYFLALGIRFKTRYIPTA